MKSILIIALLVYLGLGLLLYLLQRNFIYFPVPESDNALHSRLFTNEGHEIKVSVLNEDSNNAIIYFGGNAESVDNNAAAFLESFATQTVYMVKYRGYGGSSGSPTERGIYADALHIHDSIKADHESISIMGRSLGSAVATYVASNRDINKLILITPFDSVLSVAQSQYKIYPIKYMLKDHHNSFGRAKNIKADTLIVAAEHDQIIKMQHTQRLMSAFESKVEFRVIEDANHNDLHLYANYYKFVNSFMSGTPTEQ